MGELALVEIVSRAPATTGRKSPDQPSRPNCHPGFRRGDRKNVPKTREPPMARLAYVNGRYVPHARAMVHIEDRGYQFADGVYEVVPVRHSRLVDEEPHLDRLANSLAALQIAWPV